ncbi:hypothetical protein K438DRAFT_2032387 [Mycena galopus ATCC 62051]|nr:hypothetical protein K438DRAFT_2032387 [Mycena galopus ATCC 62051]
MDDIVNSAQFNFYWKLALREISGTCVQIFFYAIFLILFIIAIRNLHRRETAGKIVLLTFSWVMVALGTAQVVLCIPMMVETLRLLRELVKQRTDLNPGPVPAPQFGTYNSLAFADNVVFVINNLAVDLLLLYRCYVIWGREKKVLILPGAFIISTVAVGFVATVQNSAPIFTAVYLMAAATDLTLVAFTGNLSSPILFLPAEELSAGRIWLKRRDVIRIDADGTLKSRYSTVIEMIVESGALYSLFAILDAITNQLARRPNSDILYNVIASVSAQLTNILPTLIIVRAGMGHNIQDRIESSRALRTAPVRFIAHREHSRYGFKVMEDSSTIV